MLNLHWSTFIICLIVSVVVSALYVERSYKHFMARIRHYSAKRVRDYRAELKRLKKDIRAYKDTIMRLTTKEDNALTYKQFLK